MNRSEEKMGPVGWIALALIILIIAANVAYRGDSLRDCVIRASADRDAYSVGDKVTLTVMVVPRRSRKVTFSSDLYRNVRIAFPRRTPGPRVASARDVVYRFTPDAPLKLTVAGTIQTNDTGKLVADFGEYGAFEIPENGEAELKVGILPQQPVHLAADFPMWAYSERVRFRVNSGGPAPSSPADAR